MTVVVQAPATSANLGSGFDCLGLALELRDRVTFALSEQTSVTVTGEGAGEVNRGPDHLILATVRRAFQECGQPVPEIAVTCENRIPHGRGLGSSSAAIATGLCGAQALDANLADTDLLPLATRIEGHPDNVAPALLGGLTVAWMQSGVGHAVRLEPVIGLTVTLAIPESRLPTSTARKLLPDKVPFGDAVHALGRSALAVAAFTSFPELLWTATEDRIHQDYRRAAYPQSWELVQGLREQGVAAAISGAGPSVVAFGGAFEVPRGWRQLEVALASEGVRVTHQ